MSYADTIIELATDRGEIALSAFKIKYLRALSPTETEITYTTGAADNEPGWTVKAIVKAPFRQIHTEWMRGLRAWDGA